MTGSTKKGPARGSREYISAFQGSSITGRTPVLVNAADKAGRSYDQEQEQKFTKPGSWPFLQDSCNPGAAAFRYAEKKLRVPVLSLELFCSVSEILFNEQLSLSKGTKMKITVSRYRVKILPVHNL